MSGPASTAAELAARIDHSILAPEATRAQVEQCAVEAIEWGCASVCVQPDQVAFVAAILGGRLPICAVVGFPHGATLSRVKADEAAAVVALGATEVDMVLGLGPVADGDLDEVRHDVSSVRAAVPDVVLKVIVESALWTPAILRDVCVAAVDAGADFVKTSTGFHRAGGASLDGVATMRGAVGARAGVKASGGIRTLDDCQAMIAAGADRLGLSATVSVLTAMARQLDGLPADSPGQ